MPRQWMTSATMPAAAAPSRLPEMVAAEQPPDHHLALRQRHEVGNHRHADRKAAAAGRAASMRSTNSSQKSVTIAERNDDTASSSEAGDHHPRLAERVRHRPQHRLRQAVGGKARRQQRRGGGRDREVGRDLRHHRIDRAHAQRRGEDQEADDIDGPVDRGFMRAVSGPAAQQPRADEADAEHHQRAEQ